MNSVAKTEYVDIIDNKTVVQMKNYGFFVENGNWLTNCKNSIGVVAIESEIDGVDVASIAIAVKKFLQSLHVKNIEILFSNGKINEIEIANKKLFGIIISNTLKDEIYLGTVASGCYRFKIKDVTNKCNYTELLSYLNNFEDKNVTFSVVNDGVRGKMNFYELAVCESTMLKLTKYIHVFDKNNGTTLMISSERLCKPITNNDYFCEVFSFLASEKESFNYESEMGNFTANNDGIIIRIKNTDDCVDRIKEYLKVFVEECNG